MFSGDGNTVEEEEANVIVVLKSSLIPFICLVTSLDGEIMTLSSDPPTFRQDAKRKLS